MNIFKGLTKKYYTKYTIVFLMTALLAFCWHIALGRTFIWKNDGWMQVYRSAIYYSENLRNAIKDLIFNHKWTFNYWAMALGQGDDTVTTLSYYACGDPFTFLYVFVPSSYMYLAYNVISILRLYTAGITFSAYTRYTAKASDTAVISGAMVSVFAQWGIQNAQRHPYFLNALIFLPLILLGIEKLLKEKKWHILSFSVGILTLSNFYFSIYTLLLAGVYSLVRVIYERKAIIKRLFFLALAVFSGLLLAMVTLLPAIMLILENQRIGTDNATKLIYPWHYYRELLSSFFTTASFDNTFSLSLGFSGIVFTVIIFLFSRSFKTDKVLSQLKIMWVITGLFIACPLAGKLLNGFTYITNRWTFAAAFIAGFTVTALWPHLFERTKKEAIIASIALIAAFILAALFEESRTPGTFAGLLVAVLFHLVLLPYASIDLLKKHRQKLMLGTAVLGVFVVSMFMNAPFCEQQYASTCKTFKEAKSYVEANDAGAVKVIADSLNDNDYFRFASTKSALNSGLSSGISSVQSYWSMTNPYVGMARRELNMAEGTSFNYKTDDDKASVLALDSARYYTIPNGWSDKAPYGYELVDTVFLEGAPNDNSRYDVYKTKNAVPLLYTYDGYLSRESFEGLNPADKQFSLLSGALLEETPTLVNECSPLLSSQSIPFEIAESENIEYNIAPSESTMSENISSAYAASGNTEDKNKSSVNAASIAGDFIVSKTKSSIRLSLKTLPDSEIYVYTNGFKYEPFDEDAAYQKGSNDAYLSITLPNDDSGMIFYKGNLNIHYEARDNFMENVGYEKEAFDYIDIAFSQPGKYHFDDFAIFCQPMDSLLELTGRLIESKPSDIKIGTNEISAVADSKKDCLLLLNVPYSKGFRCFIDGVETKIYRANIKNMAAVLPKGHHEILFTYETPYLKLGLVISLITLTSMLIAIFISGKKHSQQ